MTGVTMDSFIVSATPYEELQTIYDDGTWDNESFAKKHILFFGHDYVRYLFM